MRSGEKNEAARFKRGEERVEGELGEAVEREKPGREGAGRA